MQGWTATTKHGVTKAWHVDMLDTPPAPAHMTGHCSNSYLKQVIDLGILRENTFVTFWLILF